MVQKLDWTTFELSDITSEDIIDTRDLAEVLEEARSAVSDVEEWRGEPAAEREPEPPYDDEEYAQAQAVVKALGELEDEVGSEWAHGETLIRESYFTEYAEQLADDIGAVDSNANWPLRHIDWEAAAEELKQDYTTTEIDGVTYYFRYS